ncbi:MAG: sigma-54-dependent Fis family transcriptional regulator, partial [Deltaproteobacteria bacterium]|nr:sigma-54-dependent Fis family transcriptional regulator [Deltaproteobacteria bacterium]
RATQKQFASREIRYLKEEIKQRQQADEFFLGSTFAMSQACEVADRVASLPTTVLITGETGTGKELMARYVHRRSHLADKPFVTMNLASVPSELMESILFGHEKGSFTGAHELHIGKFELANGGTLFLDEIGELRIDLQAKLLRVLQENEIERVGASKVIPIRVRLIAATNQNLPEKIRDRSFREDLYYRLNVVPVVLPPLRNRLKDIPQLVEIFLKKYNRRFNRNVKEFKPAVLEALMSYHWPGNIRELENFVERIVAISQKSSIGLVDIPLEYQLFNVEKEEVKEGEDFLQKTLDTFEKRFLLKILEEANWNQTQAAMRLGIHRKTLEYKIKRLDLVEVVDVERHSRS